MGLVTHAFHCEVVNTVTLVSEWYEAFRWAVDVQDLNNYAINGVPMRTMHPRCVFGSRRAFSNLNKHPSTTKCTHARCFGFFPLHCCNGCDYANRGFRWTRSLFPNVLSELRMILSVVGPLTLIGKGDKILLLLNLRFLHLFDQE